MTPPSLVNSEWTSTGETWWTTHGKKQPSFSEWQNSHKRGWNHGQFLVAPNKWMVFGTEHRSISSINGWWLGLALFQDTSISTASISSSVPLRHAWAPWLPPAPSDHSSDFPKPRRHHSPSSFLQTCGPYGGEQCLVMEIDWAYKVMEIIWLTRYMVHSYVNNT